MESMTMEDSSNDEDVLIVDDSSKPSPTPPTPSLSMVDRLLKSYVRFMSLPAHQERSLKLLQYVCWMLSEYHTNRPKAHGSFRKIYLEVSFARYVLRFLDLPAAIEAAKNNSWAAESKSRVYNFLGRVLAWSMVAYYPLEHLAYLEWQTPKFVFASGPSRIAERLSAWSCRGWLAYIVANIVQNSLRLRDAQKKTITAEPSTADATDDQAEEDKVDSAMVANLRFQLVRDLLFTLPAIHWSLPNWDRQPWLSEKTVNSLMTLEAVVCMWQSLYNFERES